MDSRKQTDSFTLMFLGLLHLLFGDAETSTVLDMEIHLPEAVRNNSGRLCQPFLSA